MLQSGGAWHVHIHAYTSSQRPAHHAFKVIYSKLNNNTINVQYKNTHAVGIIIDKFDVSVLHTATKQ